jgi:shikimate kinase
MESSDTSATPLSPVIRAPIAFLIGYRGSGKSSVGRLLAKRLGWQVVDMDETLEARHGQTVRQIFEREGEAGFRLREADLLEELTCCRQHVIATGGGIVIDPSNRRRLTQAGWVVWLQADPLTIWQRMQQDRATAERRPRLTVGGRAEVEQLLRLREPWYRECAALTVATDGRTPEEVAAEILAHFYAS